MSKKLFALLAGINDYPTGVGKLRGCVNDIELLADFLRENYPRYELHIELLRNKQATYDNIIRGFREHLGNAGKEDFVLFHYSGHGSEQPSALEFKKHFPTGIDENLVCFDSRLPGKQDMADKELAVLIREVALNCPNVTVILDCCHSGSGTREADDFILSNPRWSEPRKKQRLLESYLDGYYLSSDDVPASSHILLAACKKKQRAREAKINQKMYGLFTWCLADTLRKYQGQLSAVELLKKTKTTLRKYANNQDPVLESYQKANPYKKFLSDQSAISENKLALQYDRTRNEGQFALGILDGIKQNQTVAVYRTIGDEPVTRGKIFQVDFDKSYFEPEKPLDSNKKYRVSLLANPDDPLLIYLSGEASEIERLRNGLKNRPFLPFEFTETPTGSRFHLNVDHQVYRLVEIQEKRLIDELSNNANVLAELVYSLSHIARWERMANLQNKNSPIHPDEINLVFYEYDPSDTPQPFQNADIRLNFPQKMGETQRNYRISVSNHSHEALNAMLFYLSPDFEIKLFRETTLTPDSGEVLLVRKGKIVLDADVDAETNRFVLVAASKDIDISAEMFIQDALRKFRHKTDSVRSVTADDDEFACWVTKSLTVKSVREQFRLNKQETPLSKHLIVKGHTEATATLSLTSGNLASRSSTPENVITQRFSNVKGLELLTLSDRHSRDAYFLELHDIQNDDRVSPDAPLQVILKRDLKPGEFIIPLTYDGEDILALGDSVVESGKSITICINKLPAIEDYQTRSLAKAAKLAFLKIVLERKNINQLSWVEEKPDGQLTRVPTGLAEKVKTAQNILLVIHGIAGDCQPIVEGIRETIDERWPPFGKAFDLNLCFDYENLNARLEETALKLKQALRDVGIHENSERKITILAHYTGGLVARWLIEKEGGNAFVKHLIMAGTPNSGSKLGDLPRYRDFAMTVMSLYLMNNPVLTPYISALIAALTQSKKLTISLEQIQESSSFLNQLNSSSDPGIQYTLLAGDVENYQIHDGRWWKKVGLKFLLSTQNLTYGEIPNDIAVSVESMLNVGKHFQLKPLQYKVTCHHLNYFSEPSVQKVLAKVIRK